MELFPTVVTLYFEAGLFVIIVFISFISISTEILRSVTILAILVARALEELSVLVLFLSASV